MIFDYNNIKMCFKNIYTDFFTVDKVSSSLIYSGVLPESVKILFLFKINATHYDLFFSNAFEWHSDFLCAQRRIGATVATSDLFSCILVGSKCHQQTM